MIQSESIASLSAALVDAQAELEHAHKDSAGHVGNKFASLTAVIDAVRPVLARHGLAVIQMPGYEGGTVTLTTQVVHSSGEWIRGVTAAPAQKNDPQGVGSAITYLRRYSLAALVCIGQEDDDGHAASQPKGRAHDLSQGPYTPKQQSGPGTVSEGQRKRLFAIAKATGYTEAGLKRMLAAEFEGITSSRDITRDQYDDACTMAGARDVAERYNAAT